MKRSRPLLTLSLLSPVNRYLAQIGYRIALAAIPLLTLGSVQISPAQTTILVTTTQQGVTDPSHCSLQEAIYGAEFDSSTAVNATDPDSFYASGCVLQGSGAPFTIVLQNSVYEFNSFWDGDAYNPFGLTATPIIFADITIQGDGATLLWTGSGNSRLFAVGTASIFDSLDNKTVSGTGALTLQDVYIKGFKVKGGDGACGGGGGLGAGGAVYVGKVASGVPTLTIENSTFDSNFATGGNGSFHDLGCAPQFNASGGGGGGGGLSGAGGPTGLFGGGGGGGGSRGNGGAGVAGGGGGGGGTVFNGADAANLSGGPGGFLCGGGGGDRKSDGHAAACPGGGGGGGGESSFLGGGGSNGADGNYGGGGGGGGSNDDGSSGSGSGGNGGFGGGGGSSGTHTSLLSGTNGGNGGFGGGGGAGAGDDLDSNGDPGSGGAFGGRGNANCCGGGGGALGGAIFNDGGTVVIRNSTFTKNDVDRGEGGSNGGDTADRGADAGGAIFSLNGSLTLQNATVSGNLVTGSDSDAGGGVTVMNSGPGASVTLINTILSRNGSNDCLLKGSVGVKGSGNLILNNNGCPGVAVATDPHLGTLAVDKQSDTGTPTLALPPNSPAVDAGDDAHILPTDQRGVARPQGSHTDIGAFEAAPPSADLSLTEHTSAAQIVAGDSFTYTVQLTNGGPSDATEVVFSDAPPSGVTFNSCSSTAGNCAVSGGAASLKLPTLLNGDSVTITIQATLGTGVGDGVTLTDTPSVTSSTVDPNTNNNSGSSVATNITVQNKSDLFVTTKANLASVKAAGTLVYTVNLKNLGPFRAAAVTLVDPVPSPSTFVSMDSGPASCTAPAVGQVGTITCNFGNMTSGASATVTITVKISGSTNKTSITNNAVASSPNFDPNSANNSASVTTQIFGNKK